MKMFSVLGLTVLASLSTQTRAQDHVPLRLIQTIPMPNVKGRIDHMDLDVKGERLLWPGLRMAPSKWSICRRANG